MLGEGSRVSSQGFLQPELRGFQQSPKAAKLIRLMKNPGLLEALAVHHPLIRAKSLILGRQRCSSSVWNMINPSAGVGENKTQPRGWDEGGLALAGVQLRSGCTGDWAGSDLHPLQAEPGQVKAFGCWEGLPEMLESAAGLEINWLLTTERD